MFITLKNNLKLHYEIKGNMSGYPLIFLHGNMESLEIYNNYIDDFSNYKLILIDSRCHGLSNTSTLSYDLMAQDVELLINELKLDRFSIIGFSDGAIIAILLSFKFVSIDKLFLIGPNLNPNGLKDECILYFKENDSIFSRLCLNEPNIDPESLKSVSARAIVIGGEFDLIKKEHLGLINSSFSNSYLYIIEGADHFIVTNNEKELKSIIKNELLIDVYFEDNHVIVVDKPSGILSQSDSTGSLDIITLTKNYLKNKYNKKGDVYLGLISRLDRNVSGLMVLSKNTKSTTRLNEHRPKKKYYALVYGKTDDQGTLINKISKDEKKKIAYLDNEHGKDAVLKYKKVKGNDEYSLLDVEIENGRFHQIRFQLSIINHPIYNDKKYDNRIETEGFELGLDAYSVSFIHPVKKEEIVIKREPKRRIFKDLIIN